MSAQVERLLGASTAQPARPVDVTARVTRDVRGRFHVRLETPGDGAPRVREVKGASCTAIANVTAVIIALLVDPTANVSATPEPEPPPPPAPPEPVPPPPVVVPTPDPVRIPAPVAPAPRAPTQAPRAPSSSPRISFRLSSSAVADVGSLASVSLAFSAAASLLVGPYRFDLGAAGWPGSSAPFAAQPSTGGLLSLVVGFVGACRNILPLLTQTTHFELSPCAAFEVGRLHATGVGVETVGEGAALWSAARAGVLFVWAPIQRVGLDVRLEAAVPFARPTFVIEGLGAVHRSAPVAGRASVGVEVRF